jgi:uncharacterized protein
MSQAAKVQEPSMEEILASIRRIIADDDTGKAAKPSEQSAPKPPEPQAPPPRPAPPPPAAANKQEEIDAMLADLDAPPKVAPSPAEPKPATATAPPAPDVLDLTESMAAPTPGPAPSFRTIDATSDVVFSERSAEPPRSDVPTPDRSLISNSTVAAVDSAFNSLAYTVLGQNARTLEDLVKEMLRPMLKSWLDDNLPGLVDRIVRAEIERVSRGRP